MARLPFDTTCDLIYGPSGSIPNTVYATCSCRVVRENYQLPDTLPLTLRRAYITLDAFLPTGPQVVQTGSSFASNYDFSDRIAVPSGSVPNWSVLFVETVNYLTEPQYYRAHVQTFGSVPPIAGCSGCALTVPTWRVTWPGPRYGPPFNTPSILMSLVPASIPSCTWVYNDGFGNSLTLMLNATIPNQTLIVQTPTITFSYVLFGTFECNAQSIWIQSSPNPLFPKNVFLNPG